MTDETIPPEAIGYRIELDPRSGLFIAKSERESYANLFKSSGQDFTGSYSNLLKKKSIDVEGVELAPDERRLPGGVR